MIVFGTNISQFIITAWPISKFIIVSQVFTVDKSQLGERIGTLSAKRIPEILDGINLVTEPRVVE